MRIAAWLYYMLDRRIGIPKRFDRLYTFDADPFGIEIFSYEKQKNAHLIAALDGKHFAHILDIGCGSGTLTRMLAPYAEKVTAIDFSQKAIERATSHKEGLPNITYQCQDIRDIDFSEKYDLINCSEVLYYLTHDELRAFIVNISHSQSSGTLIVTVGKAHDVGTESLIGQYLTQTKQIIRNDNRRPYVINVYSIL